LQNVKQGQPHPELDQLLYDLKHGFTNAMDDDLNISAALAAIFKIVRKINRMVREHKIDAKDSSKIIETFRGIDTVLNIFNFGDAFSDSEVQRLIEERHNARSEQNWAVADEIRDQLRAKGVIVQDEKI
jgi:cysteinyl-tRNA synthetase